MNLAFTHKMKTMEIFVHNPFNVNLNCKVFFTLENFFGISSRLAHNFRPVWIFTPNL